MNRKSESFYPAVLALTLSFFFQSAASPPLCAENAMNNLEKLDRPEISGALFYPRSSARSEPPAGATNIDIPVAEDVVIGSRLFISTREAPVILFFHGNGEIVPDYDDIGPVYARLGLNFLVADYRGYGWSTGRPSAKALIEDGRRVLEGASRWLTDNGYTGRLFVMGRSMGSAPAIDLAARHADTLSGLIIESGFADTVPLALTLGIELASLGIREEDCFNNSAKIATVTIPTLILHGQRDSLIPLWQAQKLHAECGARQKELQIVPGADHNTVMAVAGMLYFQTIKGYVDKVTGASSWRERRRKQKQQEKP